MHNNNTVSNYSEEIMLKENKKLREDAFSRDEKLDALLNFFINMQHSIMNKTSSISVLQNSDILSLRSKISEVQEEVYDMVYKNQRNNFSNVPNNFNNSNAELFNGTMKSSASQMYQMRNFRELSEENEQIR